MTRITIDELNFDAKLAIIQYLSASDYVNIMIAGIFNEMGPIKYKYLPKNHIWFRLLENSVSNNYDDIPSRSSYSKWYNRLHTIEYYDHASYKPYQSFSLSGSIQYAMKDFITDKISKLLGVDLMKIIIKNRGVIAGGFVLKYVLECIHGRKLNWRGDIDIFVDEVSFGNIRDKYQHLKLDDSSINNWSYNDEGMCVFNMKHGVQFICYRISSEQRYVYAFPHNVLNYFDLSNVKVAYCPDQGEVLLSPLTYYCVITMKMYSCKRSLLKRVLKYEGRGFYYEGNRNKLIKEDNSGTLEVATEKYPEELSRSLDSLNLLEVN